MKKWKIKPLEEKLGIKFKRNVLSFGLDIASNVTGWCLIKTTEDSLILKNFGIIDVHEFNVITDRLKQLDAKLNEVPINGEKNKVAVIEMPFVSFNRRTAIILAMSAGVAYSNIKDRIDYVFFLTASEARKRVGVKPANCKKAIAQKFIKDSFNIDEKEDVIDAFLLSIAGLIE